MRPQAITGLVENFTMGHVVIRQFGMKQTWVKHSDFERLAVLNWTRRNTRDIYLRLCAKANHDICIMTLASVFSHACALAFAHAFSRRLAPTVKAAKLPCALAGKQRAGVHQAVHVVPQEVD